MQRHLEPTQDTARAFFTRGIAGKVVMPNLLRFRAVPKGRVMLDKRRLRQHHLEISYVLGRFMTENFIRVYKVFDGGLTARQLAEFDLETLENFYAAARDVLRLVWNRGRS